MVLLVIEIVRSAESESRTREHTKGDDDMYDDMPALVDAPPYGKGTYANMPPVETDSSEDEHRQRTGWRKTRREHQQRQYFQLYYQRRTQVGLDESSEDQLENYYRNGVHDTDERTTSS